MEKSTSRDVLYHTSIRAAEEPAEGEAGMVLVVSGSTDLEIGNPKIGIIYVFGEDLAGETVILLVVSSPGLLN